MKIKPIGAGFLCLLIAWLFLGSDSPVAGIALVAGIILLLRACVPWARTQSWYVPMAIGGLLVVAAYLAYAYIPLFVSDRSDDMPGALIHLIYFTLGIPGIVLMVAGIASACGRENPR